jgi:hypothetical protein
MQRSVLKWIALATVFAVLLPAGSQAAGQAPVDPSAGPANTLLVYLPVVRGAGVSDPGDMVNIPAGTTAATRAPPTSCRCIRSTSTRTASTGRR